MITDLRLRNFKAWRELRLRFATVTGVFGPNSAGKSSLIQFLLLLKQTREATDRRIVLDFGGPENLANLGSFTEVIHGREVTADLDWELLWTLPKRLRIASQSLNGRRFVFSGERLATRCAVGLANPADPSTLLARRLTYRFDESAFSLKESKNQGKRRTYDLLVSGKHHAFRFKRKQGRPFSRIPPPVKTHAFPPQAKWAYRNSDFLSDFELEYENLMDGIYYLGPLRDHPRRQYYWSGASPADVGPKGERAIDAILAANAQGVMRQLKYRARRRPFQEIIAHWLRELGLLDRFRMAEIGSGSNLYQTRVSANASRARTTLTDVGFGVSQVLPVLVLLYYVPKGSIVLLEQPEIHLHPAVQSRLADFLLCVAKRRDLQIIVESHSQHLLQRLQRRVAEGKVHVPGTTSASPFAISADDVRLCFSSASRGVSTLHDLRLNAYGEIENWPDGFFGDEMSEVAAITRAGLQRRMADSQE